MHCWSLKFPPIIPAKQQRYILFFTFGMCGICGEQGHNKNGHNKKSARQTRQTATNDGPAQTETEDVHIPPYASQVPPQSRRKTASQQPRRQTTSAKGKQVASQGPITAPQASHHSKFQSYTQFSEIPQQLQRHTPKSRKQAIPVSLSSRKIQKMRHVLIPTPNPSNPALKRPAASSSVQSMLKQVYALYNPKVTSAQTSSMPTLASFSMPAPTSTSMPTLSKSDVVGTVGTPKKH